MDVDLWFVYQIIFLFCFFVTIILVHSLKCEFWNKFAVLIFILFNPYTFSLYWAAPGMISDYIFYSEATIDGLSVRKEAKICGVDKTTSFPWRHRFLFRLKDKKDNSLNRIDEANETFFLSFVQRFTKNETYSP